LSSSDPLWISEADVVASMHLGEAMDALEAGLREQKHGSALNMVKTHVAWDGGNTMHAIGAVFERQGWFGAKTWGHTHGGATPLFLLWESETGRLAAVIEAFALGQMRTGGISGVATRWMSDAAADELALIGSGKQALTQVAAVALVRPLKAVRVFSPTPANRSAFAAKLSGLGFGFKVIEHDSVEDTVRDAPIVTAVTRAREPFLEAAAIAPGAHINGVGAITPERRELTRELVARCAQPVVDDPQAAQKLAIELADFLGNDIGGFGVTRLADLIDEPRTEPGLGVTLFKAMGMGISDLALAVEVLARARKDGLGTAFPHPERVAPRIRP
jgi:alanine dehydrogenase